MQKDQFIFIGFGYGGNINMTLCNYINSIKLIKFRILLSNIL